MHSKHTIVDIKGPVTQRLTTQHRFRPPGKRMADRSDIIIENYEVSPRIGFLPDKPPLARLPHPYYARWEETVSRVAPSRGDGRARKHIDEMPLLSTGTLRTLPEWHRAYTLLSILSQIYIWDGDEPSNVRVSL